MRLLPRLAEDSSTPAICRVSYPPGTSVLLHFGPESMAYRAAALIIVL